MTEPFVLPPDVVPATGDPGDDTARRYRYQWSFAAIICCMLLDETEGVVEVFCEHHEDVLMKHADGSFSGVQIKTRGSDQSVWKAGDADVKGACTRFAKLEAQFPGQFRNYLFLTNHPLHVANNGKDLRHVLDTIRSTASFAGLSGVYATYVSGIARQANCTPEVAHTALAKTYAHDDLPKLPDVEVRLVSALIGVWERTAECTYASVVQAARGLSSICEQASSLAHDNLLPAYLPATANPIHTELAARLAGKRIDRTRILEVLDQSINPTAALEGDPEECVQPGAGTSNLLLRKLDAGGFSATSRNSALDLRDKADYLGVVWIKKHGRELGLQKYGHVRSLVLSDAAMAFEIAKTEEHRFGIQMLVELRNRIRQRRMDGSELYECSNEHLEGFAYSLTSQCIVQWSIDRPWETE